MASNITSYSELTAKITSEVGYRKVKKMSKADRLEYAKKQGWNYNPKANFGTNVQETERKQSFQVVRSDEGKIEGKLYTKAQYEETQKDKKQQSQGRTEGYVRKSGTGWESQLSPRRVKEIKEGRLRLPEGSTVVDGVIVTPRAREIQMQRKMVSEWSKKKYEKVEKPQPPREKTVIMASYDVGGNVAKKVPIISFFKPTVAQKIDQPTSETSVSPSVMAGMPTKPGRINKWFSERTTAKILKPNWMEDNIKKFKDAFTFGKKEKVKDTYTDIISKSFVVMPKTTTTIYESGKLGGGLVGGFLRREGYNIRSRPTTAIAFYGSGLLFSGVGSAITTKGISLLSKGKTVTGLALKTLPKGVGVGLGSIYGGTKAYQFYQAKTPSSKGGVIADVGFEMGALFAGAKTFQGISNKIAMNRPTSLTGKTYQYYSQTKTRLDRPSEVFVTKKTTTSTPSLKQQMVINTKKPTVAITVLQGIKQGKPFSQISIQPNTNPFGTTHTYTRWGNLNYIGKLSGGLNTPQAYNYKMFAGSYLLGKGISIITPKSQILPKSLGSTSTDKITKSRFGDRLIYRQSQLQLYGNERVFTQGNKLVVEKISMRSELSSTTRLMSSPTQRAIFRQTVYYSGGSDKQLTHIGARLTRIKIGNTFKSPPDITTKLRVGSNLLGGSRAGVQYSLMMQRGGNLAGYTTTTPSSSISYSYQEYKKPSVFSKAMLKSMSFVNTNLLVGKYKNPTITIPKGYMVPNFSTKTKTNLGIFGAWKGLSSLKPSITLIPLIMPKTRPSSNIKSKSIINTKTETPIKSNTMVGSDKIQISNPISKAFSSINTDIITRPKSNVKSNTITSSKTQFSQVSKAITSNVGVSPIGGGGFPPPPIIDMPPPPPPPPFKLPLGFEGGKTPTPTILGGGRDFQYKADIGSLFLGIEKMGKAPTGKLTGLEMRPLFKSKSKKKKKKKKQSDIFGFDIAF